MWTGDFLLMEPRIAGSRCDRSVTPRPNNSRLRGEKVTSPHYASHCAHTSCITLRAFARAFRECAIRPSTSPIQLTIHLSNPPLQSTSPTHLTIHLSNPPLQTTHDLANCRLNPARICQILPGLSLQFGRMDESTTDGSSSSIGRTIDG